MPVGGNEPGPVCQRTSTDASSVDGQSHPRLGVVVVTYSAADFIAECLESLIATGYPDLRIVVVDNESPDGTADAVRAWASGETSFELPADWPFPTGAVPKPVPLAERQPGEPLENVREAVTLIETGANLGFAGGINVGLRALLSDPAIDRFWLLNPDAIAEPETPFALVRRSLEMGRYATIGGRIVFRDSPERVQIDAGSLRWLTGAPVALNLGSLATETPMPSEDGVAFISGGSVMASRTFIERVGLMDESFFLYYEEVDWQLRRGDLPIGLAPNAVVRHRAGASIGSAGEELKPSPFALYFGSRSLIRFVWRWWPWKAPLAYLQAFLRFPKHADGTWLQFEAMLRGLHRLPPPAAVRKRLPERTWATVLRGKA